LRVRVRALEPAPHRTRRRALVVVFAALAIAIVAAVVQGIVSSNGTQRPVAVQHSVSLGRPPVAGGKVPNARRALPHLPSAVVGSGTTGAPTWAPASTVAGFAQSAAPSIVGSGRLKKTEASLQVRVPDVHRLSQATSAATRIATSLGGFAQSVVYRTPAGGGGAAYIELRVPAENVQTALSRLAALGTLIGQRVSVQDLQHDFEVESAQIAQLRRTVAALQKALQNPALPDAQRVLLQIKLAETKRALSERLHARKGTVTAGTTARISLVLTTQKSIAPVVHHRGRLGRMLHSAVGFLALEGMILLYALIVVTPVALLVAAGWWLKRAWRRREEERLLAA
jgi:hypothetical protein